MEESNGRQTEESDRTGLLVCEDTMKCPGPGLMPFIIITFSFCFCYAGPGFMPIIITFSLY